MASLREIKYHIGSVRSTLKITSAMKLVSSAKLRKAQQTAEGVRPYTEALAGMLEAVLRQGGNPSLADGLSSPQAGLTAPPIASDGPLPLHPWADRASGGDSPSVASEEYILEPSREEILATLLPQVMRLRVYTVLMDSIAAEHAARMIAMQTATDNAEDLLGELTLEYNKGRQQKITSEILDLVGGAQQ